eukprot:CAMPEP_0202691566 /NCGR_PEP_ID=MMETSP1385-20130828/6247_1 /ASSEMBLY_ACC=CAM_ASM_000861 /TAXON_ID=933848 /ORGANISM="Elphidium margaritaceum" /LENGTH=517 /DNA_ID=CAMNT_0049346993 /DNA_START=24 /DNA_END=1574 /DNA_ORIENTATION=-
MSTWNLKTLFQWILAMVYVMSVVITSSDASASEQQSQKKQLSPSRLRAEGDAAFSNREYKKAIKYFNQLIDIQPDKHINFHKRALTYYVSNQYWKAVRDWSKAIELDDTFTSGYLYRGKTYTKLGSCSKGLTDLNKVYALDPNTKDIGVLIEQSTKCVNQYDTAMNLLSRQQCADAQVIIDELLEIAPYDNGLNLGLAKCNFERQDYQSVLTYTANILRADAQNLEVLLLRGRAYYQLGEKELALKHYKSGLKSDPEHKAIKKEFKKIKRINRLLENAETEMKNLQWRDALETYANVLTVDEANNHLIAFVFINRCKIATRIRNQRRESDDAQDVDEDGQRRVLFEMNDKIRMAYCGEATTHNPDSGDAYFYRGRAFKEMKKWDEAAANFKTALSKNQGNREYQQELQNAEFEKKKANRKDYYGILGVAQHASPKELKKAFRKCGLEHHPDKVKSLSEEEIDYHEAIFKECVEAHDFLSDAETRAKYDRGEDVLGQQQGGNRGGGGGGFPFGAGGFP